MTALPDWMHPPRAEGWYADDLDNLPEAPRHTELVDGALVFMMTPQRSWHARVINRLTTALESQAPSGIVVELEMTVRLDERNRPEPDILATSVPFDEGRTWHSPADVLLAVEVVSPESAHRDQHVKLHKYAKAGIPHYWIVEEDETKPVVHVYQLDTPTSMYAPTGIFNGTLDLKVPFPITLDLDSLVRAK